MICQRIGDLAIHKRYGKIGIFQFFADFTRTNILQRTEIKKMDSNIMKDELTIIISSVRSKMTTMLAC